MVFRFGVNNWGYNIIHRDNIVKYLKNSIFSLTTNNKNVILITQESGFNKRERRIYFVALLLKV
ncbi:Uncharacterised protein [Streptococcus pneumoniae]|nr:Uncharacterised protein [Streptococcus pneumoniae]